MRKSLRFPRFTRMAGWIRYSWPFQQLANLSNALNGDPTKPDKMNKGKQKERLNQIEATLQKLSTVVSPILAQVAPDSFNNMTAFEEIADVKPMFLFLAICINRGRPFDFQWREKKNLYRNAWCVAELILWVHWDLENRRWHTYSSYFPMWKELLAMLFCPVKYRNVVIQ